MKVGKQGKPDKLDTYGNLYKLGNLEVFFCYIRKI